MITQHTIHLENNPQNIRKNEKKIKRNLEKKKRIISAINPNVRALDCIRYYLFLNCKTQTKQGTREMFSVYIVYPTIEFQLWVI